MSTPASYRTCPCCHGLINCFQDPEKGDITPHAGIISICTHCGEICIVDEDLVLFKMTDEQKDFVKRKAPEQYSKMLRVSDHFRKRYAGRQPSLFPTPQSFSKN